MTDTIIWPRQLLRPQSGAATWRARNIAGIGSTALDGSSQTIAGPGLWVVDYKRFPVVTPAQILTWRAIEAQADGQASVILVPVWQWRDLLPFAGGSPTGGITHSDTALFADGAGYYQTAGEITVAADAALRSPTLSLTLAGGAQLRGGEQFSIGTRLYAVRQVVSQTSNSAEIKIRPTLREAVVAGQWCEFAEPILQCRLADPGGLALPLDYGRHSFPDVSFIEDPN